jgi:hypothetical protein
LGLPTPEGRLKADRFQPISDRLDKRMTNSVDRVLSFGGKEIMIKSVAQAIPTYIMSVFKLQDGVCKRMEQIIRNFWWGARNGKRKTHWVAWEKMTMLKEKGGVGFRDLQKFNQALLGRHAWRLLERPDSLCARILKSKYYPNADLLDTVFP